MSQKHNPPRPTVVDKIRARQAVPQINGNDLANLVFASRQALPGLQGEDFDNVAASISRVSKLLLAMSEAEKLAAARAAATAPAAPTAPLPAPAIVEKPAVPEAVAEG